MPNSANVLSLNGLPRQRGRAHGEALRPSIHESLQRWKDNLQKISGIHPDEYIREFLVETGFVKPIETWTPDLLEEVRGIGEGAGVDFDTIFAYQLLDELWWYLRSRALTAHLEPQHCSAVGIFDEGDSPPILAQNMDLPGYYDGAQVILKIKYPESDLESFVLTFAGMLGVNGMNNRPLGICCNTLSQLDPCRSGLPVAFLVRKILEQSSLEAASRLMFRVKHASGQNYLIGGRAEITDLECSAHQVRCFIPQVGAKRLYHTNHPLINNDNHLDEIILASLEPETRQLVLDGRVNSSQRCAFLEEKLRDSTQVGVEAVKAMLSSHTVPVCIDKGEDEGKTFTFGSLVMILADEPQLWVAFGPPCSHEYHLYQF